MCLNRSANVTETYLPNSTHIAQIIDVHNSLRSLVGVKYRGTNNVNPTASNLGQVKWDDRLARLAQRWAETGTFYHNSYNRILDHQFEGISKKIKLLF